MEYKKVRGTQQTIPSEYEIGKTTIYYRKNIQRKSEVDEDGMVFEFWEYDEAQELRKEYKLEHPEEFEEVIDE